jgi:hypothetical protein
VATEYTIAIQESPGAASRLPGEQGSVVRLHLPVPEDSRRVCRVRHSKSTSATSGGSRGFRDRTIDFADAGLTALAQLPTTNRLNKILTERQSVKNAGAQILKLLAEGHKVIEERNNLKQELLLTQQKLNTTEERVPVCTHGNLQARITDLEQ